MGELISVIAADTLSAFSVTVMVLGVAEADPVDCSQCHVMIEARSSSGATAWRDEAEV